MKLAVGSLLLGGALALPSPSETPSSVLGLSELLPLSELPQSSGIPLPSVRCAANDAAIWTVENWEEKDTDYWFARWLGEYGGDFRDDEAFAQYWGLGPSFICEIDNECHAPECTRLMRPEESSDYEQAAMVLASMANFNNQYSRIWQALDGAKLDFATISAKLQQTFYPGLTAGDMAAIQGLSAGTVALGLLSAVSGAASPIFNFGKEIYAGMARGISAILQATDASVQNMAELEALFADRMDQARSNFVTVHDDIIHVGTYGFTQSYEVFQGGAYVDRTNIRILNDMSVEDLRGYLREVFFSMVISNVWVKQGAYIFSRKMDEETCNQYTPIEDAPQHLCYGGRIYWLNKPISADYLNPSSLEKLPGVDELQNELGVSVHDAMISSIEAFNKGGYKFNPDDDIDTLFDGDVLEKFNARSRYPGMWNIPVCEVESSDQLSDTGLEDPADPHWGPIDYNDADQKQSHASGLQICLCSTAKDHFGVSIMELNATENPFRAQLDDVDGGCDFGDIFQYVGH